jgi:hypothetical protein
VSLAASGQLTLRLIAGGILGWAIIPLLETLIGVDALPKPLLLWILTLAALESFLTPLQAERFSSNHLLSGVVIAVAIALAFVPTPRETWGRRGLVYVVLIACVLGFAGWPLVSPSSW